MRHEYGAQRSEDTNSPTPPGTAISLEYKSILDVSLGVYFGLGDSLILVMAPKSYSTGRQVVEDD
jgi:hypothetical protein